MICQRGSKADRQRNPGFPTSSRERTLGVIIDRWGVIKGFMIVLITTICGFVLILFSKGSVVPLLLGGYLYGTVFSIGSLGLSILTAPTHVAGLPVAVNISCHATRRASAEL